MERLLWVDLGKAIGIILVVWGHVIRGLQKVGILPDTVFFQTLDSIIYNFHVPLFFFLSGVTLLKPLEKSEWPVLLSRKVDQILYPLFLWTLIQGLIEFSMKGYISRTISWLSIIEGIYIPRGHFWFLHAFFFVSVFSIFILKKLKHYNPTLIFTVLSIVFLFQNKCPQFYPLPYLYYYTPFLFFGVCFNQWGNIGMLRKRPYVLIFFVGFILSQWSFHSLAGLNYKNTGLFSYGVTLVSILWVCLFSQCLIPKKLIKIGVKIGKSTREIYLMHIIFASGLRVLLDKVFHIHNPFIHILLGLIGGILIPLGVKAVIRKYKMIYLLKPPKLLSAQRIYDKIRLK